MALLHRATIVPTKGDLVAAWLPGRPWAPAGPVTAGVSFRLDDPAGEVGIEIFLLTADDAVVQVPLSYRSGPLEGAGQHLVGTMEHSVLGPRWVYDGCADPVVAAALAATILTGGTEAEEWVDHGDRQERRPSKVQVRGSGRAPAGDAASPPGTVEAREDASTTTVTGAFGELVLIRRIGTEPPGDQRLTATWGDHVDVPLAGLRTH